MKGLPKSSLSKPVQRLLDQEGRSRTDTKSPLLVYIIYDIRLSVKVTHSILPMFGVFAAAAPGGL